jgi:hypothetical protein
MNIKFVSVSLMTIGLGFGACNQGGEKTLDNRHSGTSGSGSHSNGDGSGSKAKSHGGFRLAAPSLPATLDASKFVIVLFGNNGPCIALSSSEPLQATVSSLQPGLGGMCLLQQIVSPYAPGVNLGINNLIPGKYQVGLGLLNSSNKLIQFGIQPVEVASGATTQVTIQLQNVEAQPRGGIDIAIKQPGTSEDLPASTVLAFASPELNQKVSSCGKVSLSLRDQLNSPIVNRSSSDVRFSPWTNSTTGKFYSDPACATPITTAAVSINQNATDIFFADTTVGVYSIGAIIDPSQKVQGPSPQKVQITPRVVSDSLGLYIVTPILNQSTNACGAVTFGLRDISTGLPLVTAQATEFKPISTSAAGQFFSDGSCTTKISGAVIAANNSDLTLYYADQSAGSPVLSATAEPVFGIRLIKSLQASIYTPGTSKMALAIVSPPLRQIPGSCGAVTYRILYENGESVANYANRVVFSPTTTSAFGQFFSDAACQVKLGVGVIPAYQGGVTLYYCDAVTGTPQLSSYVDSSLGFLASPSQTVLIAPAGTL